MAEAARPSEQDRTDWPNSTGAWREFANILAKLAAEQARTNELLERIAAAVESPRVASGAEARTVAAAGVRQAIAEGAWNEVDRRLQSFSREFPDGFDASALAAEAADSRRAAIAALSGRLEASRSVNDADGVIEARDALRGLQAAELMDELDRDLAHWLMRLIQKRMRSGTVGADVALLAEKMARSFGATPEGASVRASLPVLRRSGGLCPRCAQPFTGVDEACGQCLGASSSPAPVPSLDDLVTKAPDDDPFVEPPEVPVEGGRDTRNHPGAT